MNPKQREEERKKNRKNDKQSRFPIIFLGFVVGIYCIVALMDSSLTIRALETFVTILRQIIPVLVLVFGLMFLVDLFVSPAVIGKHLGSDSGMKGWVLAIVAGIIATGPLYVWYAMLAEFREKGMRTAFAGVFLYMRSVKIQFIPMMIYYFGGLFTVVLTVYLMVFSIVVGLICEKAADEHVIPVPSEI